MKKTVLFTLLSIALFAEGVYYEAINRGLDEGKNVVIMVTTQSCPYCLREKEVVLPSSDVKTALEDFIFAEVDKDRDDYPKDLLYTRFVPSFFIVEPRAQELLAERIGYQDKGAFLEFLKLGR